MIRIENLSKFYYDQSGVTMGLRRINLTMERGEFVAITGESGSGKSTLLNVISGMDTFEEGEIYFDNHPTSHFGPDDWEIYRRDRIGFIYQNYNLIDSYTALENVEAVLLLGNQEREDRKEKALSYLDKVGLKEVANHHATQLSSGQKQRLAIARALAKETELILADEPTGNLDSENGLAIMELLYELSKDHLVVVVTHNFEQVEQYATRKIRLYSGEVVSDTQGKMEKAKVEEQPVEKKEDRVATKKKTFYESLQTARRFVSMNRHSKPHRTLFIFLFLLAVAAGMFIFFGYFVENLDDSDTMRYTNSAFANASKERLVVRKPDGSSLGTKDAKKVARISHVEEADLYDGANDVTYSYLEGRDYKLTYHSESNSFNKLPESVSVEVIDKTKFVRSASALTKAGLKSGKLPSKYDEVVVPKSSGLKLGDKATFYFTNENAWKGDPYVGIEMTVTGLVSGKGAGCYFADVLCQAFCQDSSDMRTSIYLAGGGSGKGVTSAPSSLSDALDEAYDRREGGSTTYLRLEELVYIHNPDLEEGTIRVSEGLIDSCIHVDSNNNAKQTTYQIYDQALMKYNPGGDEEKRVELNVKIASEISKSSATVLELSTDIYEEIFPDRKSRQMTVHISDKAYTDRVLENLTKAGYDAISVYRVGTTKYMQVHVEERLVALGISLGGIILIFVLGTFILYHLMKLNKADLIILKSLGMERSTIRGINFYELFMGMLVCDVIVLILAVVLYLMGEVNISGMMKYFRLPQFLIYLIFTWIVAAGAAFFYNRYIEKRSRLTNIKAD